MRPRTTFKQKTIFGLAAVLMGTLLAGNAARAAAITGSGEIDFTDHDVWTFAHNSLWTTSVVLFDDVRVTLTASGGYLTKNAGDMTGWSGTGTGSCSAPVATTLACDGDGIGIRDDEITGNRNQVLTVGFTDASTGDALAVSLTRIELLDLFADGTADPGGEIALYSHDGWTTTYQIDPDPLMVNGGTGYRGVDIDPALEITSIAFRGNDDPLSDFSLARLTFALGDLWQTTYRMSEPATLAVLAFGLAGIGFLRRRKAA